MYSGLPADKHRFKSPVRNPSVVLGSSTQAFVVVFSFQCAVLFIGHFSLQKEQQSNLHAAPQGGIIALSQTVLVKMSMTGYSRFRPEPSLSEPEAAAQSGSKVQGTSAFCLKCMNLILTAT